MNRYIKVPLVMGLSYALLYIALKLVVDGDAEGLLFNALTGFVGFALFGLFLTALHSQTVKRKVRDAAEGAFDVRQQRVFTLHLSFSEAFELCRKSLKVIGGKFKSDDLAAGKIKATTGWTMKSFGCVVSYEVRPVGEQLTEVVVTSRPKVRTTLIDYGENRDIVEKIGEFFFERDQGLDFGLVDAKLKELAEGRLDQPETSKTTARHPRENA